MVHKLTKYSPIFVNASGGREALIIINNIVTVRATTNGITLTVGRDEIYFLDISLDCFMYNMLSLNLFCRVHRSLIIHSKRVKYINKGGYDVEMDNESVQECSKSGMADYRIMTRAYDFVENKQKALIFTESKIIAPITNVIVKIKKKAVKCKTKILPLPTSKTIPYVFQK